MAIKRNERRERRFAIKQSIVVTVFKISDLDLVGELKLGSLRGTRRD